MPSEISLKPLYCSCVDVLKRRSGGRAAGVATADADVFYITISYLLRKYFDIKLTSAGALLLINKEMSRSSQVKADVTYIKLEVNFCSDANARQIIVVSESACICEPAASAADFRAEDQPRTTLYGSSQLRMRNRGLGAPSSSSSFSQTGIIDLDSVRPTAESSRSTVWSEEDRERGSLQDVGAFCSKLLTRLVDRNILTL